MTQAKADCYFTNGTEKVRFVVRFIFNLEEYARFDSDLGMFVALTELGKPDAELWNNRSDILARSRASVDMLCRRNYYLGAPFTVGRRGEVGVGVSLLGAWAWLFFLVLGRFLLQDLYPSGSGAGETIYDLSPVVTHCPQGSGHCGLGPRYQFLAPLRASVFPNTRKIVGVSDKAHILLADTDASSV